MQYTVLFHTVNITFDIARQRATTLYVLEFKHLFHIMKGIKAQGSNQNGPREKYNTRIDELSTQLQFYITWLCII